MRRTPVLAIPRPPEVPRQEGETVFYLGAPSLSWRWRTTRPLFFSYTSIRRRFRDPDNGWRLRPRLRLQPAEGNSANDSSGFTKLERDGCWDGLPPEEFAHDMDLFRREIGRLDFAIPQDWMCEDFMLELTGAKEPGGKWSDRRTAIRTHQRRTLESYLLLRDLAPDVPWAIACQGYFEDEYLEHLDDYERAGVDWRAAPRIAVGSMCKRNATGPAARIIRRIRRMGGKPHALGYKREGLRAIFGNVYTSRNCAYSGDSMAFSHLARKRHYIHPGCQHGKFQYRRRLGRLGYGNCASCLSWGEWWAADTELLARGLGHRPRPGIDHAPQRRRVQLEQRTLLAAGS